LQMGEASAFGQFWMYKFGKVGDGGGCVKAAS